MRIFFLVLCQPTTATTTTIRRAPGFIDNINGFAFLNNAHERKYVRARARDIILICVRFFSFSSSLCASAGNACAGALHPREGDFCAWVPSRSGVWHTHTPHTQNTQRGASSSRCRRSCRFAYGAQHRHENGMILKAILFYANAGGGGGSARILFGAGVHARNERRSAVHAREGVAFFLY